MTSIDIGCGFTEGVQIPVYADVSLDLNMNQVQQGFLAKLKANNSHPLCGDAVNLPIRSDCVDQIYWRAVLEHFPDPDKAIKDGKRILKKGGETEIILPIITSHMRHYLIILFTNFPFSLHMIVTALWRAHLYWHIPGVPHIRIIKPWDLKRYFERVEWKANYYRAPFFHFPWGRITRKLVNQRFMNDIQGQYKIRCVK